MNSINLLEIKNQLELEFFHTFTIDRTRNPESSRKYQILVLLRTKIFKINIKLFLIKGN